MIRISPATPTDLAACVALVPQVWPSLTQWLIARVDGRLAGAASLTWEAIGEEPGLPCWIEVVPAMRRQGVGRALVAAAADLMANEADGLWSARAVAGDDPAIPFLTALGWTSGPRTHHFLMSMQRFADVMAEITTALQRRGKVPSEARVVPAADADRRTIALLVARELRSGPLRAQHLLAEATLADGGALATSRALMLGDKLAGVLLVRQETDERCAIVANVIAPEFRGGWANAVLLEGTTRANLECGLREFTFDCDERVRDSMRLAIRGGGEETAVFSRWYYAAAS